MTSASRDTGARSVLALNSGSSSVKYALFTFAEQPTELCRGALDASDREAATGRLLAQLDSHLRVAPLAAIGHRLVHGGPELFEPQPVTRDLTARLERLTDYAPNHLPDALQLIAAVQRAAPGVPQFVCFDTAFHARLPEVARHLPIPRDYYDMGIRRYGFHGLSYSSMVAELQRRGGSAVAGSRLVAAHLGSGSSLAAIRGGQSIDTTMGLTPIGGVVMSTRTGDLDPGVVIYIAQARGMDPASVEQELSHRSGLLGISGTSGDMRELLAREASDSRCRLAVSIYCYEIKKRIGAYAAALGGIDALVFSGGIGEHSPVVRARICDGLEWLGVELDERLNVENAAMISSAGARVAVHVIAADEERVIAESGYRLTQSR
jgi:acetate kinase